MSPKGEDAQTIGQGGVSKHKVPLGTGVQVHEGNAHN